MPSGEARFKSAELGHHHHCQCRLCRQVLDFNVCPLQSVHTELPTGFLVGDHEITLYGQCADCATKAKENTSPQPRHNERESLEFA